MGAMGAKLQWQSIDEHELKRLRDRGVVTVNARGEEGLRVTLTSSQRLAAGQTRQDWRCEMERWARQVAELLQPWGGAVDEQSLSVTGQTVEAWLPIASLDPAALQAAEENWRMDIVVSHRLTN